MFSRWMHWCLLSPSVRKMRVRSGRQRTSELKCVTFRSMYASLSSSWRMLRQENWFIEQEAYQSLKKEKEKRKEKEKEKENRINGVSLGLCHFCRKLLIVKIFSVVLLPLISSDVLVPALLV